MRDGSQRQPEGHEDEGSASHARHPSRQRRRPLSGVLVQLHPPDRVREREAVGDALVRSLLRIFHGDYLMPTIGAHPSLPFSGVEPIARHCSWLGATRALPRAGSQALRLLEAYRDRGPLTDHEAADALGLPLATINARRADLIKRGWVHAKGTKHGPYGAANTLWALVK